MKEDDYIMDWVLCLFKQRLQQIYIHHTQKRRTNNTTKNFETIIAISKVKQLFKVIFQIQRSNIQGHFHIQRSNIQGHISHSQVKYSRLYFQVTFKGHISRSHYTGSIQFPVQHLLLTIFVLKPLSLSASGIYQLQQVQAY